MTTAIKRRRGTTAQHATFTGLEGELTVDTTKDTVVVHDGATAGGFPLAKESGSAISATTLAYSSTLTGGTGIVNLGSGQLYKDASGNVGIGTSSPAVKLDVRTAAGTAVQQNIYTGSNAAAATLQFGQVGAIGWNVGITATDARFQIGVADGGLGYNINRNGNSIDYHSWLTGGSERVRITSAGNVGVGTTSPSYKLTVDGGSQSQLFVQRSTGTTVTPPSSYSSAIDGFLVSVVADASPFYRYSDLVAGAGGAGGVMRFFTGNASLLERMRIDIAGNVGIGTTSPASYGKLTVENATTCTITANATGTGIVSTVIASNNSSAIGIGGTTSNHPYVMITNGTERMRIDAGGNLLVGTTSNANLASANGIYIVGSAGASSYGLNNSTTAAGVSLALFYSSYSTANQSKFEVTSEGNVKSRTNSYAGFSDERLKQNITPAKSQWNDIKNIEVVKFQMKSEQFADDVNPYMIGVIAQQVEKISPALVEEDAKDGMKTVKYSILYMKAVKALQEAMERIETLETRLNALEGK